MVVLAVVLPLKLSLFFASVLSGFCMKFFEVFTLTFIDQSRRNKIRNRSDLTTNASEFHPNESEVALSHLKTEI